MIDNVFSTIPGVPIVTLLVGIALLTLGRRLFWLAVAAIGFILGLSLGIQLTRGQADWIVLVVALLGGGIGLLLAILAQKIAVGVAGFILGGYLATWLWQFLGFELNSWAWIGFIIGGIIGLILVLSLLEIALIVLTSIVGAALIVGSFNFNPTLGGILFLALLVVGMIIQTRMLSEKS